VSSDQLADAVLIHIEDECLVLCPIEIKLYSLESPVERHPDKLAEALSNPKNQASASSRRLMDLSETWAGKVGTNNYVRPLLANGVASLIEAAMKLNPRGTLEHGVTAARLRRVADGSMKIRIGESIVAFLQATNSDRKISVHRSPRRINDPRDHVIFMADPRYVAANISKNQNDVVEHWKRAIDIATAFSGVGIKPEGQSIAPEAPVVRTDDQESIGLESAKSISDVDESLEGLEMFDNAENGLRHGGVQFEIGDYLT
jgi:hypothetical protein